MNRLLGTFLAMALAMGCSQDHWVSIDSSRTLPRVCAASARGTVACWGALTCGAGCDDYPTEPLPVPAGQGAIQVSTGYLLSCGVDQTGVIECWGDPSYSDGTPIPGGWGSDFDGVVAKDRMVCGEHADGSFECLATATGATESYTGLTNLWLAENRPTSICGLDERSTIQCPVPPCWDPPQSPLTMFDGISEWGCGVAPDMSLMCWSAESDHGPPPAGAFSEVALGPHFACALSTDGAVTCWRRDGSPADSPDGRFLKLTVTEETGCGVTVEGELECWGASYDGLFDVPSLEESSRSVR